MKRTLATIASALVAGLAGCGGGDSGTKYGAAFQSPSGVQEGDAIVVGGKEVGEVENVETEQRGRTPRFDAVEFVVEEGGLSLHRDAAMLARSGRIDLTPGRPAAPRLNEGDIIPLAQTGIAHNRGGGGGGR
jgi:hypothetical protein